jgi:hypothetical protein
VDDFESKNLRFPRDENHQFFDGICDGFLDVWTHGNRWGFPSAKELGKTTKMPSKILQFRPQNPDPQNRHFPTAKIVTFAEPQSRQNINEFSSTKERRKGGI